MTVTASAKVPAGSRLIDADTAGLVPVQRPASNQGPWPVNPSHVEGRAAVPSAADLELVERAARRNPEGVHRLAEAIRTGCPPWCSEDHRGQVTDVDGFSLGLVHERTLAELTAQDPSWHGDHPATATVLVESTTERGEVITPARVVLTVAEGAEGAYVGSENTEGWTGTPAQARALAASLLAAAELVDGGAR